MSTIALSVQDMRCAGCVTKVRNALAHDERIDELRFNPVRRFVLVQHELPIDPKTLIHRLEDAGFHPTLASEPRSSEESRSLLTRLGISGLALMQTMMAQGSLYAGAFSGMDTNFERLLEYSALFFCIPVVCYSAVPFYRRGFGGFTPRSAGAGLSMDTPIALAIVIAFSASLYATLSGAGEVYYDSVAMFTFVMLGARYLEQRLRNQMLIDDSLLASLPSTVFRVNDNSSEPMQSVPVTDIRPGDRLFIQEGKQLPVDGTLLSEKALLEEALLTGEAKWAERRSDDLLFAGTYNRGPGFQLLVTSTTSNSRIAEIDALATAALTSKHKIARVADTVARVFIPAILLIASATFLVWQYVDSTRALAAALAVLIVSCPCALSLATPAALSAAIIRLRNVGVLIKDSRVLQLAHRVSRVVFDKTGTLTSPVLEIVGWRAVNDYPSQWCINAASALQRHSSHPLASGFRAASDLIAQDVATVPGSGLSGTVDGQRVRVGSADFCGFPETVEKGRVKNVYFSANNTPAAIFELEETLRPDAASTVETLKDNGVTVELLSGDRALSCKRLAGKLAIPFSCKQQPEQKHAYLKKLQQELRRKGGSLMYVGDGINDIPALAEADLSVATLETTDLVKSKADVVLLTTRLRALLELLTVGRRSNTIMLQNLAWAFAYNLIAIPLAATSVLAPWAAALGMSLSSIIVLVNAARILRIPLIETQNKNSNRSESI